MAAPRTGERALEIVAGPYGPDKQERAIVATTDPQTLLDLSSWYLVTNLPAPRANRQSNPPLPPANLEEVIRLYGLRMWVEQSYKQVKHALGWSQYQVRSDKAIRRHWQLVCCAFSFCWYHVSPASSHTTEELQRPAEPQVLPDSAGCAQPAESGGKKPAWEKAGDHQCPGRWLCEQSEDGWSPGSCSGAIGERGASSPHLLCFNACLTSLSTASRSSSMARSERYFSPFDASSQVDEWPGSSKLGSPAYHAQLPTTDNILAGWPRDELPRMLAHPSATRLFSSADAQEWVVAERFLSHVSA